MSMYVYERESIMCVYERERGRETDHIKLSV